MARRSDHTGTVTRRPDGRSQGSLMVGGRRRYVCGKTELIQPDDLGGEEWGLHRPKTKRG